MEKIKIKIINNTGSVTQEGLLCPVSGIINVGTSISHIVYEKNMGKQIFEVVEAPKTVVEIVKEEKKLKKASK